jgi:uncharacterized protein (DUF1697 family)
MPALVAMVRGINVGGRAMVKMAELATVCEGLGLTGVRTILQSGNLVFRGERAGMAKRLRQAIAERFGIDPAILVRSPAELRRAVAANPFPKAAEEDPSHLLIMFLEEKPSSDGMKTLAAWQGPERTKAVGEELYLHYPEGIGRSKLTNAFIERALQQRGTARNWNTVQKLIAAAGRL